MLNELSAMEIMELTEILERVEPTRALSTEAATKDLIFFKAFGIDWDKNQLYKELREYTDKCMVLMESATTGYYNLV